jgi:hypothetical protein
MPERVNARPVPSRGVIEVSTRLPDPLPDAMWHTIVEQTEAYLAGQYHLAPNCRPLSRPPLYVIDGGGGEARADAS